ncbi:MAG: glycosyltransferase [Muribaculaceae bacterium]|nr:glycosyltransferase [Muribaculaceae bacterium]
MKSKGRNLYIDALTYQKKKAYGYNEYLFNLLNYFLEKRDEIKFEKIIIVCEKSQKEDFVRFSDKMEILTFSFSNILKRMWVQGLWNFFIPVRRNDVILSTANYSTFFKRSKHLLVIHDLLYLHSDWLKSKKIRYQRRLMIPRSIRMADKIIAISDFTKDQVIDSFPYSQEKIETVYNYFNFEKFGDIEFKLKKENNIISVASKDFHKNTITILRGFYQYKIRGGRMNLVMIGGLRVGSEEQYLFDRVIQEFPGSIECKSGISNSELAMEYGKSSVYVSASFFEGLGMPIVEAMFFGLILVLPKEPAVFKEVSSNMAIYFDSRDPDELTSIFLSCEKKMDSKPQYDTDRFNASKTSGKYVSILNDI